MIKPKIKSYDCTDHDPLDDWRPEDPSDVCFSMTFSIGPPDEDGADNFQVTVLTKKYFERTKRKPPHSVVLESYELKKLLEVMDEILSKCSGANWDEVSKNLSKYFAWEFENYQPYKGT